MKIRKNVMALSALLMALTAGTASAAVTTGQLTFNWQGLVPTAPVTATGWAFVDSLDIPFTPVTGQLNIVENTAGGFTATSTAPIDFFIVPIDGTATPGTPVTRSVTAEMNNIEVYMGSNPVSGGLTGNKQLAVSTTAAPAEGEVALTMNGQPLQVGLASAITPTMTTGAGNEAHINIDILANIADGDATAGSAITFNVPVVFGVDI